MTLNATVWIYSLNAPNLLIAKISEGTYEGSSLCIVLRIFALAAAEGKILKKKDRFDPVFCNFSFSKSYIFFPPTICLLQPAPFLTFLFS